MAMREGVRRLWKLVNLVYYYQHRRDNMKMWNRAQFKIQQTEGYYYIKQLFYIGIQRTLVFDFLDFLLPSSGLQEFYLQALKVTDNLHISTNFISGQIEVMLMD